MNVCSLIGRLVKEPELKKINNANNTAVCNITIAVDRKFKQDGQPDADFFNCVAWGKTAEFISKFFSKGVRIGLVGRIQTRTWTDADNKKHTVVEVMIESVYFADGKKEGSINNSTPKNNVVEDDNELPF